MVITYPPRFSLEYTIIGKNKTIWIFQLQPKWSFAPFRKRGNNGYRYYSQCLAMNTHQYWQFKSEGYHCSNWVITHLLRTFLSTTIYWQGNAQSKTKTNLSPLDFRQSFNWQTSTASITKQIFTLSIIADPLKCITTSNFCIITG